MRENLLFGSHERKTSRKQIILQDRQLIRERRRSDRKRETEFLHQRELFARNLKKKLFKKVRDMGNERTAMLEEQRSGE